MARVSPSRPSHATRPRSRRRRTPRRSRYPAHLIQWLEDHPANRPGVDKEWVLETLRNMQRFFRAARLVPRR
jgi:hypothetical protein